MKEYVGIHGPNQERVYLGNCNSIKQAIIQFGNEIGKSLVENGKHEEVTDFYLYSKDFSVRKMLKQKSRE